MQQAWDSVISNRAKGESSDDPGYRTFAKDNSFRLPVWSKKKDGCDAVVVFGRDFVRFPKMGYVRYIKHRKLRGSLKTASVIKDGSRWYVCVSAEIEVADPVSRTPDYVGVDLGVEDPIVLSNGEGYTFVPTSQKNTNRAKQLQRKISRQKKGSNRRKRTVAELSQLKRKEAAQKKSQLHKITTDLVANYTHIGRENLSVKKMTQSAKKRRKSGSKTVTNKRQAAYNRAFLFVPKYEFGLMLEYKAAQYGSEVVTVDPAYTSQTCSACENVSKASRVSRDKYSCTNCGEIHLVSPIEGRASFQIEINQTEKPQVKT